VEAGGAVRARLPHAGYRHEALVYAGTKEFLVATVAFLRDAIAAGDPTLVVVSQAKIDLIRRELGSDADALIFADMAKVGSNPGRIIAVWYAFLTDHASGSRHVRGIGEPIDARRSDAELVECQLHEALLNLAFDGSSSFWLLCPYDLEGLADEVLAEAFRTHPYVACGSDRRPSDLYRAPDPASLFDRQLPDAPMSTPRITFGRGSLDVVRKFAGDKAADFGFSPARTAEFVVAVNELATNAIEHGGGQEALGIWPEGDTLICEVADAGRFDGVLAGRIPPSLAHDHGRGLWIANQLCNLLQIRSEARGTVVRAHMRDDDR
jgi:anti-sigma regulatory factor (Ser/Thr protein kinase)